MTFDSELLSNCEKYIKSSLDILTTHQHKILESKKYGQRFFLFPSDVESYISNTEEYKSLLVTLSQNREITKKYNENIIKDFALKLLTGILNKTQSFEYNEHTFKEVYDDFKKEIDSEKWAVRIIAPLINFELDVDEMDFGNKILIFKNKEFSFNFKIRKIPAEELCEFLGMNPNTQSPYDPRTFYELEHHIDCFYYIEKDAMNAPSNACLV